MLPPGIWFPPGPLHSPQSSGRAKSCFLWGQVQQVWLSSQTRDAPPHMPAHRGSARAWLVGLDWTSALTTALLHCLCLAEPGLDSDGGWLYPDRGGHRGGSWHLHLCALQHPGDHGPVCPCEACPEGEAGLRVPLCGQTGSSSARSHSPACSPRTPRTSRCYRAGSTGRRLAGNCSSPVRRLGTPSPSSPGERYPWAPGLLGSAGGPFPHHHLEKGTPGLRGCREYGGGPFPIIT